MSLNNANTAITAVTIAPNESSIPLEPDACTLFTLKASSTDAAGIVITSSAVMTTFQVK